MSSKTNFGENALWIQALFTGSISHTNSVSNWRASRRATMLVCLVIEKGWKQSLPGNRVCLKPLPKLESHGSCTGMCRISSHGGQHSHVPKPRELDLQHLIVESLPAFTSASEDDSQPLLFAPLERQTRLQAKLLPLCIPCLRHDALLGVEA